MIKKIVFYFLLVLASCNNADEAKNQVNSNVSIKTEIVQDTFPEKETKEFLLEYDEGNYQSDIFQLTKEYEEEISRHGYNHVEIQKLEQYKRKQFNDNTFLGIKYKRQFDKGKNQKITILLYEYQDAKSSVKMFNKLANHEYRDGIFKSGTFLIHHSKYLLQIIGTCSIDKNNWGILKDQLNVNIPYMFCLCGGWCEVKI